MNQQNTFKEISDTSFQVVSDIIIPMLFEQKPPAVPQASGVYELLVFNPEMAAVVFLPYLRLIDNMSKLTKEDLDIIEKANSLLSHGGSASKHSVVDFLKEISEEQKANLRAIAIESVNPNSKHYKQAIWQLVDRMRRGNKMKMEGRKPQDGDPESDSLIWGHTQLEKSFILLQFAICHYFERYMSEYFKEQGLVMAFGKDWFLNALTDVIALRVARGDKMTEFITASWTIPRINQGLGWLSEDRINAYKQILGAEEG